MATRHQHNFVNNTDSRVLVHLLDAKHDARPYTWITVLNS